MKTLIILILSASPAMAYCDMNLPTSQFMACEDSEARAQRYQDETNARLNRMEQEQRYQEEMNSANTTHSPPW
jgi:hypothetical protein